MAPPTSTTQLTQVPLLSADRPKYSSEQLQVYFKRVALPQKHTDSPIIKANKPSLATSREHGLPLLQALVLHHTTHIPFENLELHYSAHKTISLDLDVLYDKFVTRGLQYGRGGRCMENNSFFGTVLRSLGFAVRNCAGRVSRAMSPVKEIREQQGQTYDGWNHMLNLVRLDGEWWVVDVGMGAMGPNAAYPLQDGVELESIPPRRIRLQKRAIPESYAAQGDEAPKLWCFDVCFKPAAEPQAWTPTYCFTETEFLPQDYEMMSWFTSTHRTSFFTTSLLCSKMLMDEQRKRIVGDIMLYNDVLRKSIEGERELLRELQTETERVQALKDVMDVELTAEERESLQVGLRLP